MRNEVRAQRNLQEGGAVQKLFAGHQFNRVQNFNSSNHLYAIHHRSFQINDLGQSVNFRNGVDLDFGSTMRNITLGGKLFNKVDAVTVNLGGEEKQLTAGMQVTAAEYVAVKQVLQSGQQSVSIDSSGRAVGGRIDFGSITAKNDRMRADDLSIPENVAVYGDFGKGSTFQVMGDLINGGAIYGYSSRQIQKDGTIRADNITNLQSGTIISGIEDRATHGVAPTVGELGQAGNGTVNLNLHADEVLSNYGTISGAADLTLSAGTAIHNHSNITTNGNLNVLSPTVSNKGLLQSNTGNVTFDTPVAAVLSVNNENGIVAARNGAVNLRDTAYNGTHNTYFNGGDILSKEFNVNSGQGTADIVVNQVTGVVNETGYASHVVANTENLVLGKICLTGDPTYSNTAGDITIAGNINVDESLSLIATGNITNSTPVSIIAANATKGFDINLIAGANISSGGGVINTVGPINPPPPPGVSTTIDGNPSGTGGNVTLGTSAGGLVTISTRSNGAPANQDGGNVLIAAFRLGAGTGLIDLIGSTINTGGFGTGKNGDIVILGGGNDVSSLNRAVKVGTLNQTGGSGAIGVVTIANKQPIGTATFLANGTQTGSISPGGAPAGSAGIELSGNITVTGQMTFYSGDFSSIAIDPGVQINSSSLVQFEHKGASNVIAGTASNIFAPILVFSTGTGDVGTLANRLSTNAPLVDVLGSNVSTDVFIFDNNPGLVQYRAVATNLDIQAVGTIMSGFSPPLIGAATLNLMSLTGNIGFSASGPLQASTNSVTLNAPNGSVFFNNFGAAPTNITAQTIGALNTFSITSDGDINSVGDITARDIFLQTNGDLFGLNGTLIGTNSVSLVSDVSIPSSAPFSIASPNVSIRILNGDLGTSAGTPFNFDAGVRSANLIADKGSIFVQNSEINLKNTINIRGFADNTFDFISTSPILVGGNVTTNSGNVRIQMSGTGKLTVGTGVTVSSGKDLLLRVQAPTAVAKKSIIQLNKNSTLITTGFFPNGDIDLQVGDITAPILGVPPKKFINFLAQAGIIDWGQASPKTKGPTNTVFAESASIIFNNPLKNKNITLGGGVTITAGN